MKLKWRVGEVKTGRYRGFFKRSWPSANFMDGNTAAAIYCDDEYYPSIAKSGEHSELIVRVAAWGYKEPGCGVFKWLTLKKRAKTLKEAKELALAFFGKFPEFMPKGLESKLC